MHFDRGLARSRILSTADFDSDSWLQIRRRRARTRRRDSARYPSRGRLDCTLRIFLHKASPASAGPTRECRVPGPMSEAELYARCRAFRMPSEEDFARKMSALLFGK